MAARIAGLIMRAKQSSRTAAFYERLGLNLHEHAHGGPTHFEMKPLSIDMVFELYQASKTFMGDALMLEVDSLTLALKVCREMGILPKIPVRESENMRFTYVVDMDGRDLMLFETF